jgi:hypothetical protein
MTIARRLTTLAGAAALACTLVGLTAGTAAAAPSAQDPGVDGRRPPE